MSMLHYNKGTGGIPAVYDKVVILHTASDMDSLRGVITGWVTPDHQIAIVTLEKPLPNYDCISVSMPVVCLDIMKD